MHPVLSGPTKLFKPLKLISLLIIADYSFIYINIYLFVNDIKETCCIISDIFD